MRPDFVRILKIRAAGLIDQAAAALVRLMAEGDGAGYQIPSEIPCDRLFAYSVAEAEYVDRMASALFVADRGGSQRFVLGEVAELYVCLRPYALSKPLVALQKSAGALTRMHSIVMAHCDWSVYRRDDEKDRRVFRSACFERGLSTADFPFLPPVVRDSFPSLGVYPILPYVLKIFGSAVVHPDHPASECLSYNCERDWAWSVCNAVSTKMGVNSRVFLQPASVLDFLRRVTPELPSVSLNPSDRDTTHVVWTYTGILDLLRRAGKVGEHTHCLWTDVSIGEQSTYLLYDTRADAFL